MVVIRRCLGSQHPHGPKRTVQLLASTSPHPRNYAPASASRPFATSHEPIAGWLVDFAANGRLCGGRAGAAPAAPRAPSLLPPPTPPRRPAPPHPAPPPPL